MLSMLKIRRLKKATAVDPDEKAHYEHQCHLNLQCL